ncbi:hypothetical protein [Streptomyces sp. NPDC058953]|uniref:hypothetical protein n=1 Tax=unclassified Streptomyces TaxID=2593676 RepID=UPI0036AD94AB
MNHDSLTQTLPPPTDNPCVICGRASPAAVEVGYRDGEIRYACPQHATTPTHGPVPDELGFRNETRERVV